LLSVETKPATARGAERNGARKKNVLLEEQEPGPQCGGEKRTWFLTAKGGSLRDVKWSPRQEIRGVYTVLETLDERKPEYPRDTSKN